MIFLDLVNLGRDQHLHTTFEGNLIGFQQLMRIEMMVFVLSMQLILPTGLAYMTIPSEIIAFVINIEILHTEGLLLRFLRAIEQFEEFSL